MNLKPYLLWACATLFALAAYAQEQPSTIATSEEYDAWKAQFIGENPIPPARSEREGSADRDGENVTSCDCWKAPDASYTTIQLNQWTATGFGNGDDGGYGPITLPFNFNLYGETYNTCYININGNVSFGAAISTYSPVAFPSSSYKMVAPYWADVDLRNTSNPEENKVQYKVTDNALYVNWTNVGYYNQHQDKLATFQVIISDGTNTDVGLGSNVSFCYKTMEWTTGDASMGTNGFGGYPATVGANRGNGVDYIQFGRFDHAGTDYNGPFGAPGGVGWLNDKNFVFSTNTTTSNIPPIASGSSLCDTVRVCANELVTLDVNFLSPEPDQETTVSYDITPPMEGTITEINDGPANTVNLNLQFIPTPNDTGYHVITYTATDNGEPAMTSIISVVIEVFYVDAPPPTITGDTLACEGTGVVLTASDGYASYHWSNGSTGQQVLVGGGTHYVEAATGACLMVSNSITVTEIPSPTPVIEGVLFNCGGEPAELSTSGSYPTYAWSNGESGPTIHVGTGTYTVTVTDENGCTGTSAPVEVNSANSPVAFFTGNPSGTVPPGTSIEYTDNSDPNGTTIVDWSWQINDSLYGSGQSFSHFFSEAGTYDITLTVTTSDGCTHTYTYQQIVVPAEIIVPNVFTPNGDGSNDALWFEGVQYLPNSSLKVLNRWGNEVYSNSNYKNTWRPGAETPEGTYYYILKLRNGTEYKGHVTLVR